VISLCAGVGVEAAGDALPLAARFPAELSVAMSLGPVRPVLWARPAWVAGSAARQDGATISFVDELDLGVMVRLSRQHRYWADVSAGGGLALGVAYRELLGTRALLATVGVDLVGAQ
jgi:hypothetical protein